MVIHIPGNISVSYDFFETDREELEEIFNVGLDTGPGGVVEVSGEELDVLNFLEDQGIRMDDVEVIQK